MMEAAIEMATEMLAMEASHTEKARQNKTTHKHSAAKYCAYFFEKGSKKMKINLIIRPVSSLCNLNCTYCYNQLNDSKNKGIKFSNTVQTNGTLIDSNIVRLIKENKIP